MLVFSHFISLTIGISIWSQLELLFPHPALGLAVGMSPLFTYCWVVEFIASSCHMTIGSFLVYKLHLENGLVFFSLFTLIECFQL